MHSKRCWVGLGWVVGIGALGALGGQAMVSSWAWPVLLVALAALNTLVVWPATRARTRFALSAWLLLALFSAAADPIGIAFANNFAPHPAWRLLCSVLVAAFVALWYLPAVAIVMAASAVRVTSRTSRLAMPLLLGLAIALAEYLRVTFSPVPMALLAYGLTDTPLLRAAPWVGAYGAGALAVACAGWLALALRSRSAHVFGPVVVVGSVGAVMSMPPGPTLRAGSPPATEALRVTVAMPPSMPLGHIEIAALKARAEAMLAAVAQAEGDLVVFGETALPMPWGALPASVRDAFQRLATERGLTIVMGAFRQEHAQGFNTAVIVSPARTQARFIDKHALFPLTEYLPNGMGWVRSAMGMAARDLSAGPAQVEPVSVGGRRLGLVICYEIGVPSLFAQRAADAQAMLLLSDMSWFDQPAAAAHLHAMARWRAAQARQWLLSMSTPYGAMLIDPSGVVVASPSPSTPSWQVIMPVSSR